MKGKDIDSFWMIINDIENEFIGDPGSKAGFNLAVYDAYCKSLVFLLENFWVKNQISSNVYNCRDKEY